MTPSSMRDGGHDGEHRRGDSRAPEHLSAMPSFFARCQAMTMNRHGHGDDKDYHHGDEAVHECVRWVKQVKTRPSLFKRRQVYHKERGYNNTSGFASASARLSRIQLRVRGIAEVRAAVDAVRRARARRRCPACRRTGTRPWGRSTPARPRAGGARPRRSRGRGAAPQTSPRPRPVTAPAGRRTPRAYPGTPAWPRGSTPPRPPPSSTPSGSQALPASVCITWASSARSS